MVRSFGIRAQGGACTGQSPLVYAGMLALGAGSKLVKIRRLQPTPRLAYKCRRKVGRKRHSTSSRGTSASLFSRHARANDIHGLQVLVDFGYSAF